MFERTLADLVRGIRNHKKNEGRFINQCIHEIKEELKGDMSKKALAIQKLTYITMLGYDIGWASFNIVELMSSSKFSYKRIGYLAASQSFHEGTEVITLATNQIRKDFLSSNQYEAYLALNCLSNICTPDLARDLANDLISLMSTQKTHTLKRSITVMYKVFLKYPEALRPAFPKLKEKLEDPEPSIMGCSVNVICELARKNPKNYLTLAPVLFKILTSSTTNYWMFIKIVKLFGALTPLEPRLGKKLVDPLTNIINSSSSMSLLFECIQTCIIGISDNIPLMKLCISKLRTLIEHHDQNLKYLGLLALNNIMKIHPKAVSEHRELVLGCLDDEDISIRQRALDLLTGMVTKKNLQDIVSKLMRHAEVADGSYKDRIVEKIVELCSLGTYQHVVDFEWYIGVLIRLTEVDLNHGPLIASQLLDVTIRVKVVRCFSTKSMISLLKSPKLMANPQVGGICEVLYAAAWIVGEFAAYVNSPIESLEAFLQPRVSVLPAHIQSVYMLNSLKVFAYASGVAYGSNGAILSQEEREEQTTSNVESEDITPELVSECLALLTNRLPLFTQSIHLDVQERACLVSEILKFYSSVTTGSDQQDSSLMSGLADELVSLFSDALNPVAPKAQKKVPIPEGLDLDAWINDPKLQVIESDSEPSDSELFGNGGVRAYDDSDSDTGSQHSGHSHHGRPGKGHEHYDIQKQKEERLRANASNPYMLGGGKKSSSSHHGRDEEMTHIPVANLPENLGPVIVGGKIDADKKKKKIKKFTIDTTTEMPEGAKESDSEDEKKSKKSGAKLDALSTINLDEPLSSGDSLYVNRHRSDIQREKEIAAAAAASAQNRGSKGKSSKTSPTVYTEVTSPEVSGLKGGKSSSKKSSSTKESSSAPVVKKTTPVFVPVPGTETNEFFNITYELIQTTEPNQLKLTVKLNNKSDEDMSEVAIRPTSTLPDGLTATGKTTSFSDIGVLEAGASTTVTQTYTIGNMDKSILQSIPLQLVATPSSSPELELALTIPIPISMYIVSVKLSKDKFAEILSKSGQMFLASVKLPSVPMQRIIEQLNDQLHTQVVQCHPSGSTASFYSRTTLNQHIAMLVKDRDGVTSFDIKSSDNNLSQSIVKELSILFPTKQ